MNETQRTVLAILAVALILATTFVVPWRVASSNEIRWSPIYRQPISYVSTYKTELGGSRMEYAQAEIAIDILALQVLAIGVVGGLIFMLSGGSSNDDAPSAEPDQEVLSE